MSKSASSIVLHTTAVTGGTAARMLGFGKQFKMLVSVPCELCGDPVKNVEAVRAFTRRKPSGRVGVHKRPVSFCGVTCREVWKAVGHG